jgi:hypothetical protein
MIDTSARPLSLVTTRRMSWGAIFAGVAVALALQAMLGILGIGLGANALHPSHVASAQGLGTGSAIWLFVTTMLALLAAGWVSGRLADVPRRLDSALHGVIAWALITILTLYLVTTAIGGLFSGAGSLLGNVLGAAGSSIAAQSPKLTSLAQTQLGGVVQRGLAQPQTRHLIDVAASTAKDVASDPDSARQRFNDLRFQLSHDTGTGSRAADRAKLVGLVAAQRHVSRAQAQRTVAEYERDAATAQAQVRNAAQGALDASKKVGDEAASGIATTGIAAFFFLLLGSLAAGLGGYFSTPRTARDAR